MNKEKVGSIANGKEQVIPVSPGCHVVQLQVSRLFKSQRQVVDVKPGEKVLLECGTPFTLWKVLVLMAIIQILNLLGYFGDWERIVSMSGLFLLVCYGVFRLRRPGKSICLNAPNKLYNATALKILA